MSIVSIHQFLTPNVPPIHLGPVLIKWHGYTSDTQGRINVVEWHQFRSWEWDVVCINHDHEEE